MKRFAGLLLGLGGVVGCAANATPPCILAPKGALPASRALPRSALPAAAPLGYVVSPLGLVEGAGNLGLARIRRLAPRAPNDDGGLLVNGVRFRVDGPGRINAAQEGPIVDGLRVPARFGGGFLFSSGPSLFLAKDFLAALQPFFFADSSGIQRVSFGPTFVLVRSGSGQAWSLSLPQAQLVPLPLPGLLDVASLDDGRALALLEDGRARVLRGATWEPLSASAASLPFTQVEEDGQSLWLVDARGARWGLGPQSMLERLPAVAEPYPQDARLDPRAIGLEIPKDWPLQQTPLERAVAGGVMLDDRVALVEVAGRFVKIDTRLGTLLATSEQVVSADFDQGATNACQLHRVGTEFVGVCSWWRSSVVVEDAASAAPRVRFDYFGERKFIAGPDLLYSVGPCASDRPKPGVICVREPGHDWVERELAALPPPAGASAAAAVDPDSDSDPDPDSDVKPDQATEPAPTPELWTSTASGSPAVVFQVNGRHYFVELANRVARWLQLDNPSACLGCGLDGAIERRFHINAGGRLVDGMPQQLIAASGGLLQRNDGGSSFHAIDPPPLGVPDSDAPPCSDVGCRSGVLLRLGWDTPAQATSQAPLPRVQGARWLSAEQARLGCEREGEASPVLVDPSAKRAEAVPSKAPIRDWFWHAPSIRLGIAGRAKEPAAATQTRLAFLDGLPAVAVSDLRRFGAVGLLASDFRTGLWHAYQDGRFKSYQPRRAPDRFPRPIAATRLPNGDLAVLTHDTDSRLGRVGVWTGDKSKATWAVPLMPASQLQTQGEREPEGVARAIETLALGPGNELAILRLPRGDGVVAGAAGALLLREKGDIAVLAPWASLQPGALAACAKPAREWRAVLQLAGPWLRLTGLGNSNLSLDRGSVTAAVRWRSDRVCVDWLQLGDVQLGSDFAGHFSEAVRPTLTSSRGRGTDWRTVLQPLRCAPLVLPLGGP